MFLSLDPFNSQILIWVMASNCHWTEYANANNLLLSSASTPSPDTCSSRLLQVISLLHSPVGLQHASAPACVTSTHHCSIIQQYHCVSSNVLRCTAMPVCLQTARQRRKEGEKKKKKKKRCLCFLSLPPSPSSPSPPLSAAHDLVSPVNLLFLFCQTAAAASSTALHLALLSSPLPPHACVLV